MKKKKKTKTVTSEFPQNPVLNAPELSGWVCTQRTAVSHQTQEVKSSTSPQSNNGPIKYHI